MQLDHFNIAAPRILLDSVRDFYCDVLDFEEGFRPSFSRFGYWLYSEGKSCLHLIESDLHYPAEKQTYLDHIAFRSSGLARMLSRLEACNIEYRRSYIAEFEMTQLFFEDPAGTRLEISFPGES